jgi:hypothetical protein
MEGFARPCHSGFWGWGWIVVIEGRMDGGGDGWVDVDVWVTPELMAARGIE